MVTVFVKPDCMPCKFTKKVLSEQGTPFQERDITEDPSALEDVKGLGYLQAPVVLTPEGTHWSGFQPDRIKALAA